MRTVGWMNEILSSRSFSGNLQGFADRSTWHPLGHILLSTSRACRTVFARIACCRGAGERASRWRKRPCGRSGSPLSTITARVGESRGEKEGIKGIYTFSEAPVTALFAASRSWIAFLNNSAATFSGFCLSLSSCSAYK